MATWGMGLCRTLAVLTRPVVSPSGAEAVWRASSTQRPLRWLSASSVKTAPTFIRSATARPASFCRVVTMCARGSAGPAVIPKAVRPLSTTSSARHWESKAIASARRHAKAVGRPDPFEGQPAAFYAQIRNNATSTWKLNLVARVVRGMTINDAINQMKFSPKKAAKFVLRGLYNARSEAAKAKIESLDNLWVCESFVGRGHNTKDIRYHGRSRSGRVVRPKSHYFVKLVEGKPPKKQKLKLSYQESVHRKHEAFFQNPPRIRHSLETVW